MNEQDPGLGGPERAFEPFAPQALTGSVGDRFSEVAERFADRMNAQGLPGVFFRPVVFEPTFQKHAKTTCAGCQIHVLDRREFMPVQTGVALIIGYHDADPRQFAWRQPPYEYEHTKMPIDILAGSSELREKVDYEHNAREIANSWTPAVEAFRTIRDRYLLY